MINRHWMRRMAGAGALLATTLMAMGPMAQAPLRPSATAQMVKAANAFLATLDAKQRQSVLYAFDDEQQRARWSNFPTGFVPRGGINLRSMIPAQRSAAMALLSSALSTKGFEKVQEIMEGDEVNKEDEAKVAAADQADEADEVILSLVTTVGPGPEATVRLRVETGTVPGQEALAGSVRTSSAKTCTTSRSLERHRRRRLGCCSSVATIWR